MNNLFEALLVVIFTSLLGVLAILLLRDEPKDDDLEYKRICKLAKEVMGVQS